MSELLNSILDAHGGLEQWRKFKTVEATIVSGGELLETKAPQAPEPRHVTVSIHEQATSVTPFGGPDRRSRYRPDRVAIETHDGQVLRERLHPRDAFAGHDLTTPWDPLDRAYFGGYTQWIYLNAPFVFSLPGIQVEETEPLNENGETWRALRVTLPPHIASHSTKQTFYFGDDFLQRRHDYTLDIAGGCNVAHYTYDLQDANGLLVPTRRRAYLCNDAYVVLQNRLLIWINYSDIRFS